MTYFNPNLSEKQVGDTFTVVPFTFPCSINEMTLIFDIPKNVAILTASRSNPLDCTFDYFNPLILLPGVKLHFIPEDFVCKRLVLPKQIAQNLETMIRGEKIFAYAPELGIRYPQTEPIFLSSHFPQISDLLQGPRSSNLARDIEFSDDIMGVLIPQITQLIAQSFGA